jgi:hypothetical protein
MSATTLIAALAFGCGHDGSGPASPSPPSLPASLVFAAAPMDLSVITGITRLGNLNPPGHTLPTNHIYFGRPASGIPVSAPGSGVVQVVTRGTDDALLVAAATGTSYNIGHVILDASIVSGVTLTAGQHIGVTGLSNALDLGVSNEAVNGPKHLAFVRDVMDPSLVRISIGGGVSLAGAFYVADGTPDPAALGYVR